MKKQDLLPVVIIFALILAYPEIDRRLVCKIFPGKTQSNLVPTCVTEQAPDRSTPGRRCLCCHRRHSRLPHRGHATHNGSPKPLPVAAMPEEPAPSRHGAGK